MDTKSKYVIIFIFTSLLFGCKKNSSSIEHTGVEINVKVAPVKSVETIKPIESSGLVYAMENYDLSFKTGGFIKYIFVKEGQTIHKGQTLATLDLTEYEAQVSQAKISLNKCQEDFDRLSKLYADSAATLEQIQHITASLHLAKENYNIASFNLQYSEIKSPINGVVARKNKNEGEFIFPGNPLFNVLETRNKNWKIKIGVTDKDRIRIEMNDKASIIFDALPNFSFNGHIAKISEIPEAASGLYSVELEFTTDEKSVTTGLFGKVEVFPSIKQHLTVIPIESILEGVGNKAFVYTIDKNTNKAIKKPISISYMDDENVFVQSGLDDIDEVIIQGIGNLQDGSKIVL